MTQTELKEVLKAHREWLVDPKKGKKADLTGADLTGANLSHAYLACANLYRANLSDADLTDANLRGANLTDANLRGANLYRADLTDANLRGANLTDANLSRANLYDANLSHVNLYGANLRGANLTRADLRGATLPDFQLCPQDEPFIGYKKVAGDVVLRLEILGERTSSLVGRKCRAQKVKVLEAFNLDGTPNLDPEFQSGHDPKFIYRLGEEVSVPDYNPDIRRECVSGIHFFMTEQEARDY